MLFFILFYYIDFNQLRPMHLIVTKRWMKVGTKMFFKITKILIFISLVWRHIIKRVFCFLDVKSRIGSELRILRSVPRILRFVFHANFKSRFEIRIRENFICWFGFEIRDSWNFEILGFGFDIRIGTRRRLEIWIRDSIRTYQICEIAVYWLTVINHFLPVSFTLPRQWTTRFVFFSNI